MTDKTSTAIEVPPEFAAFCRSRELSTVRVLTAFMHDLAESNGSDERRLASEWFDRVVWPESPERTFVIKPRAAELGGGWKLCLLSDGVDAGGGVFPHEKCSDPEAVQDAYDEALEQGEDWVAGRT